MGDGGDPCPPLDGLAADPVVVVLQDLAPDASEPCTTTGWGALVVRRDDQQRITSVEARLGP